MLDQLAQAGCGIEHSPRNQDRVSQRQDPRRGVRLRGAYVVVVQCVALKKKGTRRFEHWQKNSHDQRHDDDGPRKCGAPVRMAECRR